MVVPQRTEELRRGGARIWLGGSFVCPSESITSICYGIEEMKTGFSTKCDAWSSAPIKSRRRVLGLLPKLQDVLSRPVHVCQRGIRQNSIHVRKATLSCLSTRPLYSRLFRMSRAQRNSLAAHGLRYRAVLQTVVLMSIAAKTIIRSKTHHNKIG